MIYDALNISHDFIITANPYPYNKFVFVSVRNNKNEKIRC